MERYKDLKEELTDIVDNINLGDGVIIYLKNKKVDEYIDKKVIGYVQEKTKKRLELRFMNNPSTFFEKLDNEFSYSYIPYKKIDDIKIIDTD